MITSMVTIESVSLHSKWFRSSMVIYYNGIDFLSKGNPGDSIVDFEVRVSISRDQTVVELIKAIQM